MTNRPKSHLGRTCPAQKHKKKSITPFFSIWATAQTPFFLFFFLKNKSGRTGSVRSGSTTPQTPKRSVSLKARNYRFAPAPSSTSVRRRILRRTCRRRRWLTPKLRGAISFSSELRLTRFLRRWNRLDEIYTFMAMGIRKNSKITDPDSRKNVYGRWGKIVAFDQAIRLIRLNHTGILTLN